MTRVVIESPLGASTRDGILRHKHYALRAFHDALRRGEAPFAAHLFYDQPGLLDDLVPEQRQQGLLAGLHWATQATICAVYLDYGCSSGMRLGIAQARQLGMRLSFRFLDPGPHTSTRAVALQTALEAAGTTPRVGDWEVLTHLSGSSTRA